MEFSKKGFSYAFKPLSVAQHVFITLVALAGVALVSLLSGFTPSSTPPIVWAVAVFGALTLDEFVRIARNA